ncbi:hypothetical protein BJI67_15875 (plasmid) [Acidihalobacter aeolianus]|uniref:Uncharacterized protein n=1 Tax=Acidihalobacter aeolianus TaxID=2792603 RepID=A0A1D8KCN7_9GAMM|nr:hypothetical protein [Acidihalobacter aeolianus]AOV18722.1 hypothetical protein BJI67_15875 [Acidihalobacter aeolianus]
MKRRFGIVLLSTALMGMPVMASAGALLICVTQPIAFQHKSQNGPFGRAVPGSFMSTKWLTGPFAHEANNATYHCSNGQTAHLSGLLMGGGFHLISVRPILHVVRHERAIPKGAKATPIKWQVIATLVAGQ